MKPPNYIANFDSASGMLRATANYLHGEDFPLMGVMSPHMVPLAKLYGTTVNHLPERLREQVYIWSGWGEAIAAKRAHEINIERIAEWMVSEYPQDRTYPAIMIGSSNGALVHICCALGVPWLPQTMLVPIRRGKVHPDEPEDDINLCREPARIMLEENPDVVLHQMHDPNQDRLMVQRMSYFRVKKKTLGPAYEQFIADRLEPDGTIYIVECGLKWPTTTIQDRHLFQFGALGGAEIEEFLHGSDRVREYLERYNSHRDKWEVPKPDAESPEAEWGFEDSLRHDIERFGRERGYRIRRITFENPDDMSPPVADFYRQWNSERGIVGNRLLVESFILMEPFWTMRTGSVPYWMVFNKEPSAADLEAYLDAREPFDEINMMLFSHGVESVGLPPISRWENILTKAKKHGQLLGIDRKRFPRHFAVFAKYRDAIMRAVSARYPLPATVETDRLETLLHRHADAYKVHLQDVESPLFDHRDDGQPASHRERVEEHPASPPPG